MAQVNCRAFDITPSREGVWGNFACDKVELRPGSVWHDASRLGSSGQHFGPLGCASTVNLPDVFVIGAPKAGTTSIANWLDDRDDVCVSTPKEPYYWAADYPRLRRHYGFDTRKAYEGLYDSVAAAQAVRRVDGSTVYLYSKVAVRDIIAAVPDASFVVALRDPVDLLVSYHRTQLVALNEDEPDFERAWERSLAGKLPATDPLDPKLVDYPLVGRLGAAVESLLDIVSRERVHVITFEQLAQRPNDVWTALTGFLELPRQPVPDFAVYNRSNKMYRSPALRRLTHRPPGWLDTPVRKLRQFSRTSDSSVVANVKRRMWRQESRPQISEELRTRLRDYYRDDTEALGGLLSLDLSEWHRPRSDIA